MLPSELPCEGAIHNRFAKILIARMVNGTRKSRQSHQEVKEHPGLSLAELPREPKMAEIRNIDYRNAHEGIDVHIDIDCLLNVYTLNHMGDPCIVQARYCAS